MSGGWRLSDAHEQPETKAEQSRKKLRQLRSRMAEIEYELKLRAQVAQLSRSAVLRRKESCELRISHSPNARRKRRKRGNFRYSIAYNFSLSSTLIGVLMRQRSSTPENRRYTPPLYSSLRKAIIAFLSVLAYIVFGNTLPLLVRVNWTRTISRCKERYVAMLYHDSCSYNFPPGPQGFPYSLNSNKGTKSDIEIAPAKRFEAVVQIGSGGVVITEINFWPEPLASRLSTSGRWRRLLQVGRQRLGDVVVTYLRRQTAGFSGNQAPKLAA